MSHNGNETQFGTSDLLTEAIDNGMHIVVLSPHLDDAALSCGAMMLYAAKRTSVTAVTFFTEAGPRPYTLSGRRHVYQLGMRDAKPLYEQLQAEDRAALESAGITWVHAGLTNAPFRRRPGHAEPSRLQRIFPELVHTYPVYRLHIVSGQIARADAGTVDEACDIIRRLVDADRTLVIAPLAVGGHVDHVLVRDAAERMGSRRIAFYSDFPYNQRHSVSEDFIRRNSLIEARWPELTLKMAEAKLELIRAYKTPVKPLFPQGRIPVVPEVFFIPGGPSRGVAGSPPGEPAFRKESSP